MSKYKKVMYLITQNTKGRGGHYYSLKTTALFLSKNEIVRPFFFTISRVKSSCNTEPLIYCNGWNILYVLYVLNKYAKKEEIEVLHAFDGLALFFARCISFINKIPLLYTKCGGENPKGYYPYVKEMIVYSYENLNFFKMEKKLKQSSFYFIPNRVIVSKSDSQRVALVKKSFDNTKKTFLRIARFGTAYEKSIMQSIDLTIFLKERNIDVQLVLIGIVQEKKVYTRIKRYIDEKKNARRNLYIFTEENITKNASELIDVADFVIGTGRSFMEAASKHKILFAPASNSKFPILVTDKNFKTFFNLNFSPRSRLSQELICENVDNIVKLFESNDYFLKQKEFSKKIYDEYFDLEKKKEEYSKIYSEIVYNKKVHVLDFIEHFIRTVISFNRVIK